MKAPFLLQMLTLRGHSFFPSPLGRNATVLDLGAHSGEFARQIVKRFRCRCIAVEANPHLAARLSDVEGVESLEFAIAACDGQLELYLSENPEAATILGAPKLQPTGEWVVVESKSLDTLFAECAIDRADLVKMDIEGAEIEVLLGSSEDVLQRIDQISVEFHDFCGLIEERQVQAVCERLRGLGFEALRFGRTNMNWIFVRRDCCGVGPWRRCYVKHIVRRVRNALHAVRERLGMHHLGLSKE